MPNLFAELKKRKVFNSASIYLATAFVLLSAAQIIIPALLIPEWVLRLFVVLAILGFPIVVVLSWIYDIGDGGLVKTESEQNEATEETQVAGTGKLYPSTGKFAKGGHATYRCPQQHDELGQ